MQSTNQTARTTKMMLWAGRIMSTLVVLFLILDGVMKLIKPAPIVQAMAQLGFPDNLTQVIGLVDLGCMVLYAIPRTAVLGAILLTGLLGGAMAAHLRVGDPLVSHVFFSIYFGLFAWGGLYLRDERVRALIPVRR